MISAQNLKNDKIYHIYVIFTFRESGIKDFCVFLHP